MALIRLRSARSNQIVPFAIVTVVAEAHDESSSEAEVYVSRVDLLWFRTPYVLVLVLITPKSLPALILRVLASFVNSKTVHELTTQREDTNCRTSSMATARTATTWQ